MVEEVVVEMNFDMGFFRFGLLLSLCFAVEHDCTSYSYV